MNLVDTMAAIHAVRSLRRVNSESTVARKLEASLCVELIVAVATVWTDQDIDIFLSGYKRDTLRSVCLGILRGRPGEGVNPWRLAV